METKKTFNQKILSFQKEIESIKKDGKNTFFKKPDGKASTYATLPNILSAIKPILNSEGLTITQPCKEGSVFTIVTDSESGESISSSLPLPNGLNAQQMGSAITYFRRYTVSSLLSLEIDEDEDGNIASKPQKTNEGFESIIQEAQKITVKADLIQWANTQTSWTKNKNFIEEINKLIAKLK